MCNFKLFLLSVCVIALSQSITKVLPQELENTSTSDSKPTTSIVINNETSSSVDTEKSRTARVMKVLKDPKSTITVKRTRSPIKITARSDRFPPLGQQPSGPLRLPIAYTRPAAAASRLQINRRVQNNVPIISPQRLQVQRFAYEPTKGAHFSLAKGMPLGATKGNIYRPPFSNSANPNALIQYPTLHMQNFKASPHYNGQAIIRPTAESAQQQAPLQQRPYQSIQQYPLPQLQPQQGPAQFPQQQREQFQLQQFFNQQRQQLASFLPNHQPSVQTPFQQYQQQQQQKQYKEPSQQTQNHLKFEAEKTELGNYNSLGAQHGYAVYEETEANDASQSNAPLFAQNYQKPSTEAPKEAQEYINFMNTDEYFLPKQDPNYKRIDEEKDRRSYQHQSTHNHQQQQQQQQLEQQHQHQSQIIQQYTKPRADSPNTSTYSKPIQVSQYFYQAEPTENAAIVRGSYQAGSNVFVVNSEGNKAIKHIIPSVLPTKATSPAPTYTEVRYNSLKSLTPEPVRFEFTERDAVPGTYTNAPIGQLRYKAAIAQQSTPRFPQHATSTQKAVAAKSATKISGIKPIHEIDADPEDGDDMHQASSNYGRVSVRKNTDASSTPAPVEPEQKDTEQYCERMCAIVEDGDEEVVCGSDGYMYTSEAQLECYSSCLHIDVTIQSKGTCNAS
ncbi:transcription initiation factor TFIID subunit 12-like [Teleopsis dalmanni]|uniref:transcription initiation factor TFIID subunit 12-like n=1 Tax=Teleopsis dalmanni TaxID=139649 RepID=UPI0018CF1ECF|nr:transcription initiation factor TFIID subunit 12-like [Teleopsis dalmanni]